MNAFLRCFAAGSPFVAIRISSMFTDRLEGLAQFDGHVVRCSVTKSPSGNLVWTYWPEVRVDVSNVSQTAGGSHMIDGEKYRLVNRTALKTYFDDDLPARAPPKIHLQHTLLHRIFSFLVSAK